MTNDMLRGSRTRSCFRKRYIIGGALAITVFPLVLLQLLQSQQHRTPLMQIHALLHLTSSRIYTSAVTSLKHLSANKPKVGSLPYVVMPDGNATSGLLKPEVLPVVPNVVHFIWIGDHERLTFHHMLSMRSAHLFIKPDVIYFHCDNPPIGYWWRNISSYLHNLVVRPLRPVSTVFENEVIRPEHQSDLARITLLLKEGGIYMDLDVIALKSFLPLRYYNLTMGLEYHGNPGRLNNGVIVAARNSAFMLKWYETYRNFTKREWDYHDSQMPYYLLYHYPDLIHVEERTLNYPTGKPEGLKLIYNSVYDWSSNYAMHLWYRLHDIEHNPQQIRSMNNTFGQISRLVFYGKPDLLSP